MLLRPAIWLLVLFYPAIALTGPVQVEEASPAATEDKSDAQGLLGFSTGELEGRIKASARFRYEDGGAVVVDSDANEFQIDPVQDSQLRIGADFKYTFGQYMWAEAHYEHDLYTGIMDGGNPGTLELEYAPFQPGTEDQLRKAEISVRLGPVAFGGGFKTSHWGLGLLANDGDHGWRPGNAQFTDPRGGDRVLRGFVMVGPLPGSGLVFTGAYDEVVDDDILLDDDTGTQMVLAAMTDPRKASKIGIYGAARSMEASDGKVTDVVIVDIYGRTEHALDNDITFIAEVEGAIIGGETALAPNPTFPEHEIEQAALASRLSINGRSAGVVTDFLAASGDNDFDDETLRNFQADVNYHMGLVLHRYVVAAATARAPVTASNPDLLGVPAEDLERLPTQQTVTNTWALFPKVWYRPIGGLELYGGPLMAFSDVPQADPFQTRLNGGEVRNALNGEPGRYLGTEWDIGARYTHTINEVTLGLGAEFGHFMPGDAFEDAEGRTMPSVQAFRALLQLSL